jgi:ABC-type transport system substrate-binding protein
MTTSRLTAAWISAPILLALLLIAGPAAAQDAPRQGGILKAAMSDQPIKELIGTGPFRFVEHRPDRHIRLARFQDSSARVGFKVDLQVLDWATLVQRRNKPELWDLFTTGITFGPDPALTSNLQCDWPG